MKLVLLAITFFALSLSANAKVESNLKSQGKTGAVVTELGHSDCCPMNKGGPSARNANRMEDMNVLANLGNPKGAPTPLRRSVDEEAQ